MGFLFKLLRLPAVFAASAIVVVISACAYGQVDVNEQVHSRVYNIQQAIEQLPASEVSTSSNPYDLVNDLANNNKDFEALVALGNAALPELKRLLGESEEDGLREQIYAIALEQISKVNLRRETEWRTGKEFLDRYTTYLRAIPDRVKLIADASASDAEKIEKLKELGTPAIPYLFDVINLGHPELSPALDYLTDYKLKGDIRKWSIEHVDQLNLLSDLVEN